MTGADPGVDLDALLDDALEGFDHAAGQTGGPAATAAAVTIEVGGGPSSASEPDVPTAAASAPSQGHATSGGTGGNARGLAFDPLARRRGAGAASAERGAASAGPRPAAGSSSSSGPRRGGAAAIEDVDVLAEGLSQLLAELAQAEEQDAGAAGAPGGERDGAPPAGSEQATGGSSGGSSRAAAAGASQQGRSQQRDLHATLHALSQQAPSFADSGEHPESEEELLRLLTQHLGALGGAAGVGSAAAGAGGGGGGGGEGAAAAGAPPEMASLVDTIMQQLLSKEVLYQPMKDIGERYPSWLAANRDKLTQDEYQRYEKQHGFIRAICAMYESTPADFAQLVDLLQQMQQCGQPPQEIVDELAPGMQFGPDGLPTFGGGEEGLPPELKDCTIQ